MCRRRSLLRRGSTSPRLYLGGRTLLHVYADASPGPEFERVEPELEDVYFSVMAGHQGARAGSVDGAAELATAAR